MKVLLHHFTPFSFAHGGLQTQILRTRDGLQQAGVEVGFLRWYDGSQTGDVLHFFGRIPVNLLRLARQKGMKIVMSELLTESGSRSVKRLRRQALVTRLLEKLAPGATAGIFAWQSYRLADACTASTAWEARLMNQLFGAPTSRVHVVPNGAEEIFLQSTPVERGPWLLCVATITERKRIVELAAAAVSAKVPLWIIGKPYAENDPYFKRFTRLVKEYPQLLRYEGEIRDRAELAAAYREARGFVLLSAMETLSLSAGEAAACECPLLLSDLPWARSAFENQAAFYPIAGTVETATALRRFYDDTPNLPRPMKPKSWIEIGRQLNSLYQSLSNHSDRLKV